MQESLKLLKEVGEQSFNKSAISEMKRKIIGESRRTDSRDNQEHLLITTATKKFKLIEEESFLFSDYDKENDEIELFLKFIYIIITCR